MFTQFKRFFYHFWMKQILLEGVREQSWIFISAHRIGPHAHDVSSDHQCEIHFSFGMGTRSRDALLVPRLILMPLLWNAAEQGVCGLGPKGRSWGRRSDLLRQSCICLTSCWWVLGSGGYLLQGEQPPLFPSVSKNIQAMDCAFAL